MQKDTLGLQKLNGKLEVKAHQGKVLLQASAYVGNQSVPPSFSSLAQVVEVPSVKWRLSLKSRQSAGGPEAQWKTKAPFLHQTTSVGVSSFSSELQD